jgi:hypothetical protein
MITLKKLIRTVSIRLYGTSVLDEIVEQGFKPVDGKKPQGIEIHLPEDCELYEKGEERIIYNGRTDKVVWRYLFSERR